MWEKNRAGLLPPPHAMLGSCWASAQSNGEDNFVRGATWKLLEALANGTCGREGSGKRYLKAVVESLSPGFHRDLPSSYSPGDLCVCSLPHLPHQVHFQFR